jgi:hypothetical protein
MRIHIIFLLFFSISGSLNAQTKENLNKIWVSPYLEYLDLRKNDTAYFDYGSSRLEKYVLEKEDSVLRLIQYQRIYGVKKARKEEISYKIIKLTADTLIIHPLTKYSKVFLENTDKSFASKFHVNPDHVKLNEYDTYVFVDKSTIYDKHLKFEKLYFSSTSCLGKCPSMEFEIDSLRNLQFNGRMHTGDYIGNYSGKLTEKQFGSLNEILKFSALDKMPKTLGVGIDAPNYKLIISYNKQTKEVAGGFLYPYFNRPLFTYLLTIFEQIKMTTTDNVNFTLPNKSENR